jgi:hypothetical protein
LEHFKFESKVTTENLIIIKGGAYNDIKKALRQWIELYSKELEEGLTFQLFKNGRGNHIIKVDDRIDNERFYYLINYLNYPEGIDYKIDIKGFTLGKENNKLRGKKLLVYNSLSDKEYDNVFVTTSENENFKVDFGGKITETRERRIFIIPTAINMEYPETIKINRKKIALKKDKLNVTSLEKRFKIFSLIAFGLLIIGIIINQFDTEIFIKYSFFLGTGTGVWFFADYKMLQSDKLYLYSLGIAIGYLIFIVIFIGEFNKEILAHGALYPITFLIIQKPTRLLYKAIFNREPVVDRPPPTFWDIVYIMILYMALLILPYIIMDVFNK